jgi:CRP-like cAMP-binding protein
MTFSTGRIVIPELKYILLAMENDPFQKLSFFAGLSPAQLQILRSVFVPCDMYVDTVLFEQGALAEFLYIVVTGEVLVSFKPDDAPRIPVARVRMGGVVGWSAALGSRKYTSAAITTEYTQLLRVRGSDLRQVFRHHPTIGEFINERLADVIAQRTRVTHAQVKSLLELGLTPVDTPKEAKQ